MWAFFCLSKIYYQAKLQVIFQFSVPSSIALFLSKVEKGVIYFTANMFQFICITASAWIYSVVLYGGQMWPNHRLEYRVIEYKSKKGILDNCTQPPAKYRGLLLQNLYWWPYSSLCLNLSSKGKSTTFRNGSLFHSWKVLIVNNFLRYPAIILLLIIQLFLVFFFF